MNNIYDKSKVYNFKTDEPYLSFIKNGIKKIDGRINSSKVRNVNIGDIIRFYNLKNDVFCKVVFKHIYYSFYSMLECEGLKNLIPQQNVKTIDEGVQLYRKFKGSEREKKMGVAAIGIIKINPEFFN